MKLTFENNQGKQVTVEFAQDAITDAELELDINLALEPLLEALKAKITKEC